MTGMVAGVVGCWIELWDPGWMHKSMKGWSHLGGLGGEGWNWWWSAGFYQFSTICFGICPSPASSLSLSLCLSPKLSRFVL